MTNRRTADPAAETRHPILARDESLHLALAMRGGVSLAVWIGGAVQEIDRARRSASASEANLTPFRAYWDRVLAIFGYDGLRIDVMAGASAGGLNAALYAQSLVSGAPFGSVKNLWLDAGDLSSLLQSRDVDGTPVPRDSVLDGKGFHVKIEGALDELHRQQGNEEGVQANSWVGPIDRPFDVYLTATVLEGMNVPSGADQFSLDKGRRSGALFRFRHYGPSGALTDFDLSKDDQRRVLGRAARTTASFPAAFEAMDWTPGTPGPLVGSERALELPGVSDASDKLLMVDGGVVDNIPVLRTLQAIAADPTSRGEERWLLYLQPAPGERNQPMDASPTSTSTTTTTSGKGLVRSLKALLKSTVKESVLDDLDAIREHNNTTRESAAARRRAITELAAGTTPATVGARGADPSTDAAQLVRLILEPVESIWWLPPSTAVPVVAVSHEIVGHISEVSSAIASQLARRYRLVRPMGASGPSLSYQSVRPFAPLVRTAAVAGRWARLHVGDPEDSNDREAVRQAARRLGNIATTARFLDSHVARLQNERLVLLRDRQSVAAWLDACQTTAAITSRHRKFVEIAAQSPMYEFGSTSTHLQDLANGDLDASQLDGTETVDAVRVMWERLKQQAEPILDLILAGTIELGTVEDDPERWFLEQADDGEDLLSRLDLIDLATVGIHRGAAVGIPAPVRYARLAGSNLSPLAANTPDPPPGPRFTSEDFAAIGPRDVAHMSDVTKLAGSGLANFSAFVSPQWRANDWMWGQLDAAKTLLDITIDPQRLRVKCHQLMARSGAVTTAHEVADELLAQIRAIVCAPSPSVASGPLTTTDLNHQAKVDDALLALRTDQVRLSEALWESRADAVRLELRALTAADDTPLPELTTVKSVLLTRRHWDLLAIELPRLLEIDLRHPNIAVKDRAWVRSPDRPLEEGKVNQRAIKRATSARDLQSLINDYQGLSRRLGPLVGESWLAAVGVRAASMAARVVIPVSERRRPKALLWLPLQAGLVLMTGAVLAGMRTVVGVAILADLMIIPRLSPGAALGWWIAVSAVALGGFAYRRKRKKAAVTPARSPVRRSAMQTAFLIVAVTVHAAGLVLSALKFTNGHWDWLEPNSPDCTHDAALTYQLLCLIGGAATVLLLWHWATRAYRVLGAAFTGSTFWLWSKLSANWIRFPSVLRWSERFAWSFVVVLVSTTWLATKVNLTSVPSWIDPERESRHPKDDRESRSPRS